MIILNLSIVNHPSKHNWV